MAILDDIDRELMGTPPLGSDVSDEDVLMGALDGIPASQVLGPVDVPVEEAEESVDYSGMSPHELSKKHSREVENFMKAFRSERAAGNRNPLNGSAVVAAKEKMEALSGALADMGFWLGRKPPRGSR